MHNQSNFESSLTKGSSVTVKWIVGGRQFSGPAVVTKVNKASIVVELSRKTDKFPSGYKIIVPRSQSGRWTNRNCVLPTSLSQIKSKNP